jgi:hypothetical protein
MQILEQQLHQLKMLVLKLREVMQQQNNLFGMKVVMFGIQIQTLLQMEV